MRRDSPYVLDNEDVDDDGDVDFHKQIGDDSFSRSLPAVLRVGVAHEVSPQLTLVGNYDQAFTEGFGMSTTPRLASGVEYRLSPWFPVRAGLSVGGRRGNSSAVGLALGPFHMSGMQLRLFDLALVSRGGFFPGLSKGTALSLQFFQLSVIFEEEPKPSKEEARPPVQGPEIEILPRPQSEKDAGVEEDGEQGMGNIGAGWYQPMED